MFAARVEKWSRLEYQPASHGSPGVIRTLSFKIGEVTRISQTRITRDDDNDNGSMQQRWAAMMAELSLPVDENESG